MEKTEKVTKNYLFETDQFGISEQGIHLLRSRFNYQTITFGDIHDLSIKKGPQVNNWIGLLVFGVLLFAAAFVYGFRLLDEYFFGHTVHVFYAEQFVIPVIPGCVGGLMLFNSLKRGINLQVYFNHKTKTLSLESLRKKGALQHFISFLQNHHQTKCKVTKIEAAAVMA